MENYRIVKYNVDGYDSETKTVNEFYGCFFHGCLRCYTKVAFNPLARKLMRELFDYTIKRENDLKCMGYSVISIWECIQINNEIKSNNRYKIISNGNFCICSPVQLHLCVSFASGFFERSMAIFKNFNIS